MPRTQHMDQAKRRELIALAGFVVLCGALSALGGLATSTSVGTWYQTLAKPPFNPPDWIFAPVWTTLYILIAISGWRIWRLPASIARTRALVAFGVQLLLNLTWSFLFFGLRDIVLGLAEIILLLLAIVVTDALFWRLDRPAGALFLPYVAWVFFATILNASLWLLN